jgi:molecular chaperone DnaK
MSPPSDSGSDGKYAKDRKHTRFKIDWRVTLSCDDWPAAARVAASNASRGGVFLLTDKPPPIGKIVELTIQLPDAGTLKLQGTVVHVVSQEQAAAEGRGAGIGVRIDARHEMDLVLLESMAAAHDEARLPPPARAPEPDTLPPVTPAADTSPPVIDNLEGLADLLEPGTNPPTGPARTAPAPTTPPPAQPTPRPARSSLPPAIASAALAPAPALERTPTVPPGAVGEGNRPVLARMLGTKWVIPAGKPCPALGLDFGTTYTSVSVAVDDLVYLVPDEQGRVLFPSVVSYPEKAQRLTGWEARERLGHDPRRTIPSVKRLLGHKFSDPMIAGYLQSVTYRTAAGPSDTVLVEVDGTSYAVPQIAAAMIAHARDVAERTLGTTFKKVALTCPVTFTEDNKAALRRAAQLAGLEVIAFLMEPVAGALAYGLGQKKNEIVAVYDFGGGTFDFSLLDMSGDHARIVASEGDAWLGGDDFDLVLAQAVADAFWRATKVEVRQRVVEWQRLLLACEEAKRALSSDAETELLVEHLIETPRRVDLRQRIARELFERLCQPLFERSLEVCRLALDRAGLEPEHVTQLVVTGGVGRIPFVREGLARAFGRDVTSVVNPEAAIALGAGLRAATTCQHPVRGVARRQ